MIKPKSYRLQNRKQRLDRLKKPLRLAVKTLLFIIVFVPFLIGLFKFFLLLAKDDAKFVTLTGYGFAIFLGVSTMLFNWQRSTQDKALAKKLYRYAVDSVLCCFCFIMAMVCKYLFSEKQSMAIVLFDFLKKYYFILKWTSFLWLIAVMLLASDIFISFFYLYINERNSEDETG
ncbi:hypothetical protein ACJVDH_15325 [Pedobacter sp. AW1-32]|uniref:hypothetical protein n=1 Tax=Pedobacter sp. AW1-32 TaxID=3383026 RepID=UPI003FEE2983